MSYAAAGQQGSVQMCDVGHLYSTDYFLRYVDVFANFLFNTLSG